MQEDAFYGRKHTMKYSGLMGHHFGNLLSSGLGGKNFFGLYFHNCKFLVSLALLSVCKGKAI